MTKSPIEPFGNAKADLFYWVKQYLAGKMFALRVDKGHENSFDAPANRDRIIGSKTYDELKSVVKEIRRNGMNNFSIYFAGALSFCDYVENDEKISSIKEIDTAYRDQYFTLSKDGLRAASLKSYFTQVNSIFKFIEDKNAEGFAFNLSKKLSTDPIFKDERNLIYLARNELKLFLAVLESYPFNREDPSQIRFMMKLICFGGLRTEELLSLKPKDLSFVQNPSSLLEDGSYLCIAVGDDGKKNKIVYIRALLVEDDYNAHMKHRKLSSDFLFCNKYGGRYDHRSPAGQLSRLFEHVGIQKKGIDALRHSYIADLIIQKVDYAVLSELFGHNNLEMNCLYMQVVQEGKRPIVKRWKDV